MTYKNPNALMSTEKLSENIDDPNIVILDGTYHLPNVDRDASDEFNNGHIKGAQYFNIDKVCDLDSDLPHMLPSPDKFAEAAGSLGISNEKHVVVYDVYGMQSAARTWWMFRVFGHDKVSVLNGGLPKWLQDGNTLNSDIIVPTPQLFKVNYREGLVRHLSDIFDLVETHDEKIIDARTSGRFFGTEPEPRPGMRSGHIPGSVNLPFGQLISLEDKTFLCASEIEKQFLDVIEDIDKPIVTTCGSGVTACILALALFLIGKEDVAVYDGSWSEWGSLSETPIMND